MYARLHDGENAYFNYHDLIINSAAPNLWNTYPVFQIDGNFGATAGVAEMLLQCNKDFIYPLFALPKEWKNGSVKGLTAYVGITVDMEWENNRISVLALHCGSRAKKVNVGIPKCKSVVIKSAEKIYTNDNADKILSLELAQNADMIICFKYY